jgi:hypothetical protein
MAELLGEDGGELIDVPVSWERAAYPGPAQMADAVTAIMRDWPECSRRARERAVRHFDSVQWVRAHDAIFRNLLAS